MTDVVDFQISDIIAIGHDKLNVIVFKRVGQARKRGISFNGYEWRAVNFVYRDKNVLVRCVHEIGVQRPETIRTFARVPADLREYRGWFKIASPRRKKRLACSSSGL